MITSHPQLTQPFKTQPWSQLKPVFAEEAGIDCVGHSHITRGCLCRRKESQLGEDAFNFGSSVGTREARSEVRGSPWRQINCEGGKQELGRRFGRQRLGLPPTISSVESFTSRRRSLRARLRDAGWPFASGTMDDSSAGAMWAPSEGGSNRKSESDGDGWGQQGYASRERIVLGAA